MSSSSNSKVTDFIKVSEHLCIPFQDIKEATKNFTALIGKGGYGLVYKGELLLSGKLTYVAVKRLNSNISGQGLKEFLTEIHLLSHYKHPNLVSLLGFCEEHDEKILIYDYAEYGSLDKYLTTGKSTSTLPPLTWMQRINICVDAARGLDFLHNHVAQDHRVIHRDIKSANVLLGQGWKAMIADFGLSKIGRANENVTFLITNASGTHGYCDPAYMDTGILTKESDVYSFGVVLFEVLCGRLAFINVNSEQRFLAPLVKRYYEKGRLSEIIDPYLKIEVDPDSLNRFSEIAYQCLLNDREQRPSMGLVLKKLEAEAKILGGPHENLQGFKSSDGVPSQANNLKLQPQGFFAFKEVISRDGQMKLQTQVLFASIDERSERASGACTSLVTIIADWFQNNRHQMPIKSELDTLIREGSFEWRNLCENELYRKRFPDKHFDLETVLQAKTRNLVVVPEKSFIGFFQPNGLQEGVFDILDGAVSFDIIWDEISEIGSNHSNNPLVYIVGWNDHFFILKVEKDAYYIIDTLGETLYEGCNQAYILKFDQHTTIRRNSKDKRGGFMLSEGKKSCKEYIKSFLAAIPLRDLQADVKKGLMAASSPLVHHRLQIEFHYTKCL